MSSIFYFLCDYLIKTKGWCHMFRQFAIPRTKVGLLNEVSMNSWEWRYVLKPWRAMPHLDRSPKASYLSITRCHTPRHTSLSQSLQWSIVSLSTYDQSRGREVTSIPFLGARPLPQGKLPRTDTTLGFLHQPRRSRTSLDVLSLQSALLTGCQTVIYTCAMG